MVFSYINAMRAATAEDYKVMFRDNKKLARIMFEKQAVEKVDDLSMLVKKLRSSDSRWILSGLMLAFSGDDFSVHEEFVQECLASDDELVRETALHVYVSLQKKIDLVDEQCARFADDPSPKVAWIANDRLSLN